MSAEHLMLLEPSDFRSIRIECRACGTSVSQSLQRQGAVPGSCPGCGEDFGGATDLMRAVTQLWDAVAATRQAGEANAPFRIQLELSPMGHAPARPAAPART
jgi:hypothetical protein